MPARVMVALAVAFLVAPIAPSGRVAASCEVVASTAARRTGLYGEGAQIAGSITVDTVCSDPRAPAPTPGGGDGGSAPCSTRPLGPLEEVQAVWAAVNAEQAPDPSDPNYVEDVTNPGGIGRVVETSWYRVEGASIQVRYTVTCPGANAVARWVTVVPDSSGNLVPQVRAIDLVGSLHAEVVRRLPTPELKVGPADEDPDGWTYVQNRTFFWVDQGARAVGDGVRLDQRRRHHRHRAGSSGAPRRQPGRRQRGGGL